MLTRRHVVLGGAAVGAAALVPLLRSRTAGTAAPVPGGTLDPTTIPKYVTPLFILPAMPPVSAPNTGGPDLYSIGARQFAQQILPSGLPISQVFGFGSAADPTSFHAPAFTIEARVGRQTRVTWTNQLVTQSGDFRPHLFTIDPTLHWANPPGGTAGRDSRPDFNATPPPYRGPVPLVVHLHGAHSFEEADGYPSAWYLPNARNIPSGYARVGSFYDQFKSEAQARSGVTWGTGNAIFQYRNDQRATTLWYHSHELGITRANVYAGLSGFYLLRGGSSDLPAGVLPGPAPASGDPMGKRYYEIPLVLQDKSFNADGTLFFPTSRDFFGDVPPGGPFIPTTDVPPYWNPEFFGNTIVVNGRTWPSLTVEPRRYRFRLLNSSNTRVYILRITADPLAPRPAMAALPMWQIGSDGGFLPAPVPQSTIQLAPAERADVIVDFTGITPGTRLYFINEGPDEPFGGGEPGTDFEPADVRTTGQVMRFVVGTLNGQDRSVRPDQLHLPTFQGVGPSSATRRLSLNEMASASFDAPVMGMLGTVDSAGNPVELGWGAPVTERLRRGVTETWELHNFTEDAHPIHLHLVQFQVVDRRPFGGAARPPEAGERGLKDTVVALPSEITRLRATFDTAGRYVWHCHIIDHEDNEMMRPYIVS